MASQLIHFTLRDAAPYRRMAQFAPQAGPVAAVPANIANESRRILGLPARTPVLSRPRPVPAGTDDHRDAA